VFSQAVCLCELLQRAKKRLRREKRRFFIYGIQTQDAHKAAEHLNQSKLGKSVLTVCGVFLVPQKAAQPTLKFACIVFNTGSIEVETTQISPSTPHRMK